MTAADAAAIFVLAGIAAFGQSLSGFGFSLLLVPPLAMVLGPREAVVLSNLLGLVVNAVMASRLHHAIDWRLGGRLLLAAAAGMPFGLAILLLADPRTLRILIAVAVLVATAVIWRGGAIRRAGPVMDFATGFLSGVLNTSTSMSGPPVVLYLQGKGVSPSTFRATLAAFFLASSLLATVLFAIGGRIDGDTGRAAAAAIGAVALGYAAGGLVYRRLDARRFRGIVIVVLFLSAILSLLSSVFA